MTLAGVPHLSVAASEIERQLFRDFEDHVQAWGFTYLSVPSLVCRSTVERQGVVAWEQALRVDEERGLAGSAEQGILERFADSEAVPGRYWALNQCFRAEQFIRGFLSCYEFRKIELYGFETTELEARARYLQAVAVVREFLKAINLPHRVVDVSLRDGGETDAILRDDIECHTERYGWVETHSMSYFGTRQTARLGITGARYSWCATGLASPRILIPVLEARGLPLE